MLKILLLLLDTKILSKHLLSLAALITQYIIGLPKKDFIFLSFILLLPDLAGIMHIVLFMFYLKMYFITLITLFN